MKSQTHLPIKAVILTAIFALVGLASFAQPNYDNIVVSVGEQSVEVTTDNQGNSMFVVEFYSYNVEKSVKLLIKNTVHARESTVVCSALNCEEVSYDKAIKRYTFLGIPYSKVSEAREAVFMWIMHEGT